MPFTKTALQLRKGHFCLYEPPIFDYNNLPEKD